MKVQANLEVDLNSRIYDLQQALKRLHHDMAVMEQEKTRLLLSLQEKTAEYADLMDSNSRPLTDEERVRCEAAVSMIASTMRYNADEHDPVHPSARQVIQQQLSAFRPPMTQEVVCLLLNVATGMVRESTLACIEYQNRLQHQLLRKEFSLSTIDSKEEDASSPPRGRGSERDDIVDYPHSPPHGHMLDMPRDPSFVTSNSAAAEFPRGESGKSTADGFYESFYVSNRTAMLPPQGTAIAGMSRKTKALVEGTTVITHGHYGSYKVKYCFISKDLQNVICKDMFERKEPKVMFIRDCSKYVICEYSQLARTVANFHVCVQFPSRRGECL